MPSITFVLPDGTEKSVEADPGANLMRTALAADIASIVAECGGAAMCATCHVYVDEPYAALFPPVGEVEDEMLDSAAEGRSTASRLSCQLTMPDRNITLRIPASQQ
ncbi:2Fe-2S iron-sulfur cluster-binding protein [Sphingomonas sp. MG17]|jgi:2Fe-2S ferredoxin|uniref:2Fe-2S iron-sulfur cluster-binding protein n=1 Tax=Sphingomonas tagetis TaxID=2949092 RepID=A0A9X2KLN1_9SPHN|nr:2Fe-2S iron-sulfur cluster-binding protein [Sphingomonas tagetis]MCP3730571.1 2Fe-2S iron-sulfur cluster-binding protein [Sphingomonas tagetis]